MFPTTTQACSWVLVIDESKSRVLIIGEIKGHTIESFEHRQVFGVVVEPKLEYRSTPQEGENEYQLFPHGVGADCSSQYFGANDKLRKHFAPGKLVTVIGYESTRNTLGNLSLGWGDGLDIMSPDCTVAEIAEFELAYPLEREFCGSELFHSYKEIAQLAEGNEVDAVEILSRLSQARHHTKFESLVSKYVSSEESRSELMRSRYADAMKNGCAVEPEHDYNYDEGYIERRIQRSRWFEYCTRERQDAARDGA